MAEQSYTIRLSRQEVLAAERLAAKLIEPEPKEGDPPDVKRLRSLFAKIAAARHG